MSNPEKTDIPQPRVTLLGVEFSLRELIFYFNDGVAIDDEFVEEFILSAGAKFTEAVEIERERIKAELEELGVSLYDNDSDESYDTINLLTQMATQGMKDIEFFRRLVLPQNTRALAEYTAQLLRCSRTAVWYEQDF